MLKEDILAKLADANAHYLSKAEATCPNIFKEVGTDSSIRTDFFTLYKVEEITFEDNAPRKEALENVISSMDIEGVNFIYLILGNEKGVTFYYGVAKDFSLQKRPLTVNDIGEMILKPSLQGNFRGSVVSLVEPKEKKKILQSLEKFSNMRLIEGVPGINKDDEKFQSVDRIIDVMLGDEFALLLVAKPLSNENIYNLQDNVYRIYDSLSPLSKASHQQSRGSSTGESSSDTKGSSSNEGKSVSASKTEGKSSTDSHSKGTSDSHGTSTSKGKSSGSSSNSTNESGSESKNTGSNTSDSTSNTTNEGSSQTEGATYSKGESVSKTTGKQLGQNTSSATTLEVVNKRAQEWVKYLDEVVLPRFDYGLGKGMYVVSTQIYGNNPAQVIKLENAIRSVYGGESGNKMPLKAFAPKGKSLSYLNKLQIPELVLDKKEDNEKLGIRNIYSQMCLDGSKIFYGSMMSSQEISLMAGLPQKEVVGLTLKEEVDFGLNMKLQEDTSIPLGYLVQSGSVLDGKNGSSKIPVYFDKEYFDKHIFITGVTGSGKTTTCQKLLLASGQNFMVIEPAKTEYRVLAEKDIPDLLVFTLGKENGAPFRLNPFEFFEGESITSRADMIKASMEAAFDMEAAIPQILERAIYACYEDKGWDVSTNTNRFYANPYADAVYAFPTLSDLEKKIESVVKEQGFDERLKNDYIGSIKARLQGLLVGAKGLMLDTPRSLNFVELLDHKVVLELENIKSASEKSLIMGFILTNLSEAIKFKYAKEKKVLEHITLIEEAHRLLSRYEAGDSLNKKQGVEMFSDMLAEVRKYGESLIIVDQIPNKLTSDVLKNTNTKIVHKIFAQDDKEAIGNTMALKDEQKEHLSYLVSGRAVMMHPGLSKAIQVQIEMTDANDTSRIALSDACLRDKVIEFYRDSYKSGLLPGLEVLKEKPSFELVQAFLGRVQRSNSFAKAYYKSIHNKKLEEGFVTEISKLKNEIGLEVVAKALVVLLHKHNSLREYPQIFKTIEEYLIFVETSKNNFDFNKFADHDLLDGSLL